MQGIADRAERPVIRPALAAVAWAVLAAFVCYGSIGTVSGDSQHIDVRADISLPDIAQNVLLYIPFGALGVWALRRNALSPTAVSVRVMAIAVGYSSAMELLQLVSASRIASPLDVIANVAGAWAGIVASAPFERALGVVIEIVRPTGFLATPARYGLAAALVAMLWYAWYPFDITLDVSTLSDRTRPVRLDPWLYPGAAELWRQGGGVFVLTAILAASLPRLTTRAAPVAALTAVAISAVIDLGQLAMGSRPVGGAVLVSQAAGACAGAAAVLVVTLARRTWYAAA